MCLQSRFLTNYMRPDFIGLGSGRSGTNWLSACLFEHPEVCVPTGEVHFFSRERNWSKGFVWYEDIFAGCAVDKKKGELSASYFADPQTPERIYNRYPGIKLIVSLRNPVERAFSNYVNELSVGLIDKKLSFLEAVKERPEYINAGRHATNLKRYLRIFPREQILIIIFDDIAGKPREIIGRVFEFIGVDKNFVPAVATEKVNRALNPRFIWLNRIFARLSGFFNQPALRPLWWLIKKTGITKVLLKINARAASERPLLTDSDKIELYQIFKDEIGQLEKLLDRKLPSWHYIVR